MKACHACWTLAALVLGVGIFYDRTTAGEDEQQISRQRPSLAASAAKTAAVKPVELFEAIENEQVAVKLIPRNSKRVTMQITNKTKQPLTVNMPDAFAAMPVLGQFFNQNQNNNFGANNNNNSPQALGSGFPQQGLQNQQNGQFNQQGNPFNFNQRRGFPFNIPPEKTIVVKAEAVCLEYGKPDPQPRIAYEIRPLKDAEGDPQLAGVLAQLGAGECTQREAQLAAWHLASDMSWKQLEDLKIRHANGRTERQFSPSEVKRAKGIVAKLDKAKQAPEPAPNSPGESYSTALPVDRLP